MGDSPATLVVVVVVLGTPRSLADSKMRLVLWERATHFEIVSGRVRSGAGSVTAPRTAG